MDKITCQLKGCDVVFINQMVQISMRSDDSLATNDTINAKVTAIANSYTISDCTRLILRHGDMHDAFVKYAQRCDNRIVTANKLQFHRNLALGYIKEIIKAKINHKIGVQRAKLYRHNYSIDRICAICIDETSIADADLYITKCNHAYHRHCIIPWINSHTTCPTCRQNIAMN
jgi:hypothetical protein